MSDAVIGYYIEDPCQYCKGKYHGPGVCPMCEKVYEKISDDQSDSRYIFNRPTGWYFWDEAILQTEGPFKTKAAAQQGLDNYYEYLSKKSELVAALPSTDSSVKLELIRTSLNRQTFKSEAIRFWVESNSTGLVLNLFAGKTALGINEIRNDIDKAASAHYHKDALDFVVEYNGEKFDTVILDPPYTYRKSMEMYNGNLNSRFKLIADNLPDIITPSARVISFGYHSTFLGKKRGYELEKMCIFAHGGAQHCTIAIIETSRDS